MVYEVTMDSIVGEGTSVLHNILHGCMDKSPIFSLHVFLYVLGHPLTGLSMYALQLEIMYGY